MARGGPNSENLKGARDGAHRAVHLSLDWMIRFHRRSVPLFSGIIKAC